MKAKRQTRPDSIETTGNNTSFNWNVTESENGFEFDTVQVAGETTPENIKYAMMLEHYTAEEIYDMETVKKKSSKTKDKAAYREYKKLKDGYAEIIREAFN